MEGGRREWKNFQEGVDDAPFSDDITTNYLSKGNHPAINSGMGTDAMNDA